MKTKIPIISALLFYFKIFYSHIHYKIFILILLIFLAGIFESIGISIVIPLLSFESEGPADNRYSQLIFGLLNSVGVGVSLSSILLLLVMLFSLKGIFKFLQLVIASYITTNFLKDMRINFCRKCSEVRYDYFIEKSMGYFNDIISKETENAIGGLNQYIKILVSIAQVAIYVSFAFLINIELTIVVLILAAILFLFLRSLGPLLQKLSIAVSVTNIGIQSETIQKLNNFKYLKATNRFKPILDKISDKVEEERYYKFKHAIFRNIPSSVVEILSVITLAGLVWFYVGYKDKNIAEILVLLIFFNRALMQVLRFQSIWLSFSASIGGIYIINKADKEMGENREQHGTINGDDVREGIELKDVNFYYKDKQVLFKVNIAIPKNKAIGIVGPSGAGKTTLVNIITGLIVPKSGIISIDGTSYRDIDMLRFRDKIGYVTQEPVTFNDTIANNISFWDCSDKDPACRSRVEHAARMSNCSFFINECAEGLDTMVGEKGVCLSGGQRQRVAIAREMFKRPQIMIFDEATSSLDSESEMYVQKSIDNITGKVTLVVIAHRLSTVRNCDVIYVIEK